MVLVISIAVLVASLVYLLNKKHPVDGPFEVSNLFGRIIAVSILVAAAAMALTRIFDWPTVANSSPFLTQRGKARLSPCQ